MKLIASVLLLALLVAQACGSVEDKLTCDGCLKLADLLRIQLAKLEPDQMAEPEVDEVVGEVKPRRRLRHPRSETQIFNTLDALCGQASMRLGEQLGKTCERVISTHREALEQSLYEDGFLHVRDLLCSDLAHACAGHELYDSGEL